MGALGRTLYSLHLSHLSPPLASFSLSLPPPWGVPLAWSLSALPLLPLLVGLLVHLILAWTREGKAPSNILYSLIKYPKKELPKCIYSAALDLDVNQESTNCITLES